MRNPAFTLVEVVVMMAILSITLVGIYSLINSGQKLATQANNRLTAVNLARAGLEGVASLRDTFVLKKLQQVSGVECFFSVDGGQLVTTANDCPDTNSTYILNDDGTLRSGVSDSDVYLDENGWHTQCYADSSSTMSHCATTTPLCTPSTTTSCKTPFSRKISFLQCEGGDISEGISTISTNTKDCIQVLVDVEWGGADPGSVRLEQVLTRR